jgi:hypothetical protein
MGRRILAAIAGGVQAIRGAVTEKAWAEKYRRGPSGIPGITLSRSR